MNFVLLLIGTGVLLLPLLHLSRKAVRRLGALEQKVRRLSQLDGLTKRLEQLDAQLVRLQAAVAKSEEMQQRSTRGTRRNLDAVHRDLRLAIGLGGLGLQFPLFLGDWAIDGVMARELVDTLERQRPKVVLELGSGSSTVIVAAVLRKLGLGDTRHIAVDHLQEFLDATARQLQLQGIAGKTEFWLCPLAAAKPGATPWYDGLTNRLGGIEIDLVLVDGPPGTLGDQARRPALGALRPFLSERAVVILDDAGREDEIETLTAWQEEFPELSFTRVSRGKGFARIERKPT